MTMDDRLKRTKRALVIGNNNYEDGKILHCCVNDAHDVSQKLRMIGFQVTIGCNLTYLQMMNLLTKFRDEIQHEDLIVFFFSGHGIQFQDHNYLICIDNKCFIDNLSLFQFHSVSVQVTLELLMTRKPFATLMLLDCCRSILPNEDYLKNEHSEKLISKEAFNPFTMAGIAGSLIVFTCGPNGEAFDESPNRRNSLFTFHLLKHLDKPNLRVEEMMCLVSDGIYHDSGGKLCSHRISCLRTTDIYLNGFLEQISSVHDDKADPILPQYSKRSKLDITTIAGGREPGVRVDQLHGSVGLCFNYDQQIILIADTENDRIIAWHIDTKMGEVVAGDRGTGNRLNQLNKPIDIIIDEKTNTFIISDRGNRRVLRWPRQCCQDTQEILENIIVNDIDCWGLAIDQQGSLYVSDTMMHAVRRFDKDHETGIVVAGGHGLGSALDQFNYPTFIFIDSKNNLYVSDSNNQRVMKWTPQASEGILIIGGNGPGCRRDQLISPQGLCVDRDANIYVADSGNDRIMFWPKGANVGTILLGKAGKGKRKTQLNVPMGLSLDDQGNQLYVSDYWNHRLQRISFAYNHQRKRSHCNLL